MSDLKSAGRYVIGSITPMMYAASQRIGFSEVVNATFMLIFLSLLGAVCCWYLSLGSNT